MSYHHHLKKKDYFSDTMKESDSLPGLAPQDPISYLFWNFSYSPEATSNFTTKEFKHDWML